MRQFAIGLSVLAMAAAGAASQAGVILDGMDQGTSYSISGIYDYPPRDQSVLGITQTGFVGNYSGSTGLRFARTVLILPLPELPAGRKLESATLEIKYYAVTANNPPTGSGVDLYHLQGVNHSSVDKNDYKAAGTEIKTDFVALGTTSNTVVSQDVYDFVKADYANDPSGSLYTAFRLQKSAVWANDVTDNNTAAFMFTDTFDDNASVINLILTTSPIPEPSSLGLLGVGSLLMLRRRRN